MSDSDFPPAIEIFYPGRHTDDQGRAHDFSAADVADMARGYDPSLREAPLTIGHPRDNLPAWGWVSRVDLTPDGRATITARDVDPRFAEMVRRRHFPKRSAAFYPPAHPSNPTPGRWYLRHVAFLGAQPPALPGLAELPQFADERLGLICFSEAESESGHHSQEDPTMTESEQAALARAERAEAAARAADEARLRAEAEAQSAQEKLTQFADAQRAERHASHVAFCESLAGRLLPKDVPIAAAALDVLADAQPVSFAEGEVTRTVSALEWLKSLLASAPAQVQFGEFAPAGTSAQGRKAPPKDDAELDARAKAYQREHKVSYADALRAVAADA